MPIFVSAAIVPRNSNTFYLVEDIFFKGGLQIRNSIAERDAIEALNRKEGMLVLVIATNKVYRLSSDLTSWSEFEAKPYAHTHDFSQLVLVGGKIPAEYLPAISITETSTPNSQAAMLALTAQKGDVAVRTDIGKSFILSGDDPSILGNWVELLTPGTLSVTGSGAIQVGGTASNPVISIANATSSTAGAMSAADKAKLEGIATGANAYVHPSGDGSLHVPATGTSNAGKVLTAGATAGSLSWTPIPYDFALSAYGQSSVAADLLALFLAPRAMTIASGSAGVAFAATPPTTTTSLVLSRNGNSIGTVTFSAGSSTGTVSISSTQSIAVGDAIRLVNSLTPDTTIEDIAVTIRGSV